jgi:hypothetical protein
VEAKIFWTEKLLQYPRRPTQSGTVPCVVEEYHNLLNRILKLWSISWKKWNRSPKDGTGAESGTQVAVPQTVK